MLKQCQRLRAAGKHTEADTLRDTAIAVLEGQKKRSEDTENQMVRRLAEELERMIWTRCGNPELVMKVQILASTPARARRLI